jgi:Tol biopolymer transport system component
VNRGSRQFWCLAGGLAISLGACSSEDRSLGPLAATRLPVAWLADDSLLFSRLDTRGGSDVFQSVCDHAGLYVLMPGGRVAPWSVGDELCHVLASSDEIVLSPDRRALFYVNKDHRAGLRRFDLAKRSETILLGQCKPGIGAPAFSPDGLTLAFVGTCAAEQGPAKLHLVSPDGSNLRSLVQDTDSIPDGYPSWAPDGLRIVVQRGELWRSRLAIVDTPTGRRLDIGQGGAPVWSPVGDWIAYTRVDSTMAATPALWLIRPDGRDARPIVPAMQPHDRTAERAAWIAGTIVWSRDGSTVVFPRGRRISTVDSGGTALRDLLDSR